jgi:hypothetical protein
MAGQSDNVIAWKYTDDEGNFYRLRAKKAITDQLNGSSDPKVGGEAADQSIALPPRGFRPRKRYVTYNGLIRSVVCYDTTCDLWAVANTTVSLQTAGDTQSFTATKMRLSERVRGGIVSSS